MSIELITETRPIRGQIRAAIFDFDGTISTLRSGWEPVMRSLMVEMIGGGTLIDGLDELVDRYIDESAGIQTVFQMRWLARKVAEYARNPEPRDEWWYKREYNRRLTAFIAERKRRLREGIDEPEASMIAGAAGFLRSLKVAGLELYVASGTDHADVEEEVALLGLSDCFAQICGAPEGRAECPKEALIRGLMRASGLRGDQMAIVGDGKVEIALGAQCGAFALGVASDEASRRGINQNKRKKLIAAGASAMIGDFLDASALLTLLLG